MRLCHHHRLAGAGLGLAAALVVGGGVAAGMWNGQPDPDRVRPGMAHGLAEHVMLTPDDLEWVQGPDALPSGATMVLLRGNPADPGPFTMRIRLPAGYEIPAHTHPQDEHVTVISGTFHLGMGERLDRAEGKALPAGSFAAMPRGERHFAFTDEETVIQLHGTGPWQIRYLNPADDPRQRRENERR